MTPTYKKASRDNKTLYNVPVHCLLPHEIEGEFRKGAYPYFHAPNNAHNRFMSSIVGGDKLFLRDYERPAPFTIKHVPEGGLGTRPSVRPTSARRTGTTGRSQQLSGGGTHKAPAAAGPAAAGHSAGGHATAAHAGHLVQADMGSGRPLFATSPAAAGRARSAGGSGGGASAGGSEAATTPAWRTTVVQAFRVQPHKHGHGEGGAKPFHQSYSHYKYHGFAGQGAKTSWGAPATKLWRVPGQQATLADE